MSKFDYTVVATTFNDGEEIVEFLDSICGQTILPSEIIVADGGSKDDTIKKIQSYSNCKDIKITVVSDGRLNIAQGYNLAIKNVKTEYVGVTGVGNYYQLDYFEKLIESIMENNLDVAYSPVRGYDSTPYAVIYNKTFLNGDKGDRIPIATNHGVLMKTRIFPEMGYFYEKFIYAGEDAEFYQRVKDHGYKTAIVDEAVALWYTPSTRSEFMKQIRNYSIADIQILGKSKILEREKKNILKVGISIGGLVCLACAAFANTWLMIIIATLYILFHLLDFLKNFGKSYIMILEKRVLKLFYYMKFRKYFAKEYRVCRKES